MVFINVPRVSMDSSQYSYHPPHATTPIFHYPGEPSTSTALFDPTGHHCTIGPAYFNNDTFTKKTSTQEFQHDTVPGYPSPPPTSSQPKRSVPLPSLTANGEMACCVPHSRHFGGILDSPIVVKHEALGCHAPLSPPPTIPTPTQALPPADDMLPSISEQEDYDEAFPGLPSPSRSPIQEGDGDGTQHLLSPLSPDWVPNQISSDMPLSHLTDDCVLLHRNPHGLPRTFDYFPDPFSRLPPYSSSRPALSLLDIPSTPYHSESSWDEPLSSLMSDFDDDDSAPSTPLSAPQSPLLQKISLEPEDIFADRFPEDKHEHPFIPYPSPPEVHHLHFLQYDDDDIPDTRTSPSSPSLRSFSSLPELDDADDDDADADDSELGLLRAPSLPPPSPGSTLLALPGADPDDELLPAHLAPPGFIPPGADPVPATPLHHGHGQGRSLLLLDDPNDVPPPRSPSPENFHLDPALLEHCADPEVRPLYDMRRRAQAAERAARQLEARMLEEGAVRVRWEARRARKREKERGGEIAAMLRLKLTEGGCLDGGELEGQTLSKGSAIRSMAHLVAKMLLRRGDTARSLADRKTPGYEMRELRSPLSRSTVRAGEGEGEDEEGAGMDMDVDVDAGDDDDDDDGWPPVPWPMDPMDVDKDGYQIPG